MALEDKATGVQYYHLAKLLLALYNPEISRPTAGLQYPRAHLQLEVSLWTKELQHC